MLRFLSPCKCDFINDLLHLRISICALKECFSFTNQILQISSHYNYKSLNKWFPYPLHHKFYYNILTAIAIQRLNTNAFLNICFFILNNKNQIFFVLVVLLFFILFSDLFY